MLFDACDAEKIATWKGEIESTINSFEDMQAEIEDYFRTNGEHDPAEVIKAWDSIVTINEGDTLWGAFVKGSEDSARAAASAAGVTLTYGTPPNGYGNANWDGMTLWYVA